MRKFDIASIAQSISERPRFIATIAGAVTLAGLALINRRGSKRAEQEHPPQGKSITVDGVRLHYVERGVGPTLVLLHGNGATLGDFEVSGLLSTAAEHYHVIAFDRPGFGYSARPRSTVWTPAAQAALLNKALHQIGIVNPLILGHSWGTMVALAMAIEQPAYPSGLILVSGYYFPTPRADIIPLAVPAVPLIGDVVAHTLSPLSGKLMSPAMFKVMFSPLPVAERMSQWPLALALRPSQVRAAAADTALMVPSAASLRDGYDKITVPVAIIGGDGDKIVSFETQAVTLHERLGGSKLVRIEGAGHMVHYSHGAEILEAIDWVAGQSREVLGVPAGEDLIPDGSSGSF